MIGIKSSENERTILLPKHAKAKIGQSLAFFGDHFDKVRPA